ncbi:solute carrier family 46 member 2-like [Drosophila montana]|uniref:solute carrier family 46 member 2-like n=1 Tax=Drosophila montana TaxID=40370 RepID=UPI00313BFCF1
MAKKKQSDAEPKQNYLQQIWHFRRYMVIEPFFFFYFMASVLNQVALQNFPLEKACRVNLGYSKAICTSMLDKSVLGIECDNFNFENTTNGATPEQGLLGIDATGFNYTVCKAEVEVHKLSADVSGKRAPIEVNLTTNIFNFYCSFPICTAAMFPLIVLLFAGGWSDRYNKRKPCMILPVVGEALGFTCLLISAIFFDSLPMEFGMYLEAIVPSLCGSMTFCLMAIYSYITIATPEEDRVFRFGIFAMFTNGAPLLGVFSGVLFNTFGYIISFAYAVVFQIIAILYIIFFIKEIKPAPKKPEESFGADSVASQLQHAACNMVFATTNLDELTVNKNVNFQQTPHLEPPKVEPPPVPARRSLLKELFDPTLVVDCLRFPLVKRKNKGRFLLILLILAYFLTAGPATGENDYWYRYTLKKLNWNGNDFSIYSTISSLAALVGTFIGTAILSKMLQFSDSAIGTVSALSTVGSHVLFALATSSTSFYVAVAMDMFISLRVIAIKAIGSTIVDGDELSKMYSIFGISEPISQFIFPPIYSEIYQRTVDKFPGAIFLFGEIFYVPNVLVFVLCYFLMRRRKSKEQKNAIELAQNKESNGQTNPANGTEITRL